MNESNIDRDFNLLVSKFKDHVGLIKATDICKKRIAREKGKDAQYRRNLLARAVSEGLALPNNKHPNHNKYAINFNLKDRVNPSIERTFDPSVLDSGKIVDLPPLILKTDLNIEHWEVQKANWMDIYRLLRGFQSEGKINLKLLPDWYQTDLKKIASMEARGWILIYKILKLSWSEMKEHMPSYEGDYNDMFHRMLVERSICYLNRSGLNLVDRPHVQIKYLRDIDLYKKDPNMQTHHKNLVEKFLGSNLDRYLDESNDPKARFARGVHIENALANTENKELKGLMAEWKGLIHEAERINTRCLSRKTDKDRTAKYEKKLLDKILFSLENEFWCWLVYF